MPTPPRPLAHSANTLAQTHDLEAHLRAVASLAARFARSFSSDDYARCAGLWHDLGKNARDFQARLTPDAHLEDDRVPDRVDHSSAGALHALEKLGRGLGLPLAFVIAGHHAGLADCADLLDRRLAHPTTLARLPAARANPAAIIPDTERPQPPPFLQAVGTQDTRQLKRSYEFWVRMLFSCLVDADFLDTEAHFDLGRTTRRSHPRATMAELLQRFNAHMGSFSRTAGAVNEVRQRVLADCRSSGRHSPSGVFTLSGPTGCGKTLAGMGFALEHAVARGLDRVLVVIPYTSIIDQNAAVYREVFGQDNVIDHHASLDPSTETPRNRLATENWDAPIIVTTSVQFIETLFANRTSKCRKLHNVARSVVIFDEVQTLPIGHLIPILDALKELVANYGVSIVLSTATQPALQHRQSGLSQVFPGFEAMTEIVADVPGTFAALRRVEVTFDRTTLASWEELALDVLREEEILVITHLRADARTLAELVPGSIHLSALMCPVHRLQVIVAIKDRLRTNHNRRERGEAIEPVRVVTTQLVEAGVDLDFPVVFRAMAGFDSIAQAAGRCNREGRLARGRVRVFRAPTRPPPGTLRDALAVAETMLAARPDIDPLAPELFNEYFRRLYFPPRWDIAGIQALREAWMFRSVAEAFHLIDDGGEPVVVPFGDAGNRLTALRDHGPSRDRLRALQPFVVNLYRPQLKALEDNGALETVADTVRAVRSPAFRHLYHDRFGLTFTGLIVADPSTLVS